MNKAVEKCKAHVAYWGIELSPIIFKLSNQRHNGATDAFMSTQKRHTPNLLPDTAR
jgi:hypothetical protein